MVLLQIDIFGLSIAELIALMTFFTGVLGTLAGFLLFFRSDQKKRMQEARQAHLTADQQEIDLKIKLLKDLDDIEKIFDQKLTLKEQENEMLIKENLELSFAVHEHRHLVAEKVTKVRQLMARMKMAYWEADRDGQITFVNEEWLKLFGMSVSEALETNINKLASADDYALEELKPYAKKVSVHNKITNKDYEVIVVSVSILDYQNNLIKTIGVTEKLE